MITNGHYFNNEDWLESQHAAIARWQEWYENLESDLPRDCNTYEELAVRLDLEDTKLDPSKYGFSSKEIMMKWLELNWSSLHSFPDTFVVGKRLR